MRRKSREIKKPNTSGISIKWKLLFYLALFTAFVLFVVWLFQVVLLNRFYESTKLDELNEAAVELAGVVSNTEKLKDMAEEVLSDAMIVSRVYRLGHDGYAYRIMSQDWVGNYYLKTAKSEELEQLFNKARKSSDGAYYFRKTVNESTDAPPRPRGEAERKEMVYVQMVSSENDIYIIMLNMMYTPLDSTVNTLNLQFLWIAIILLSGAVILSGIISNRISTPIVKMNESARKLATGSYDADFEGEGYRETCELADTLNYASAELSKVDTLQKELIANVSHDLRTPLTMITGYSEVMRDIPGENTPENVQVIIDESTRLTGLVNDILDISKIQSGTVGFEKNIFNLTETVRSAMTRYGKLIEHDGYTIAFHADTDVSVCADRNRILQVIYNLINNAVNYAGEDKTVEVRQTTENGVVRIAVRDNGEGIAPEDIDKIWDRYYKVDRVHKRAVVGSGLGLSIVKGVLEAHNAAYGIESTPGEGSTFWFELNLASEGNAIFSDNPAKK